VDWHDVVFYTAGGPIVMTFQTKKEAMDAYQQPPDNNKVICFNGAKLRMGKRIIYAEQFAIEAGAIIASAIVRSSQ